MTSRKKRTTPGDKTICLPMGAEVNYEAFVKDTVRYRAYLDQIIGLHPELFPVGIEKGYWFHGFVESGKLHLSTRRIRSLHPELFVLPLLDEPQWVDRVIDIAPDHSPVQIYSPK